MQCYVYKSINKEGLYLYVEHNNDFSRIPEKLLQTLGDVSFVIALDLTPERKLAKEDAVLVLKQLSEKGYFVQMPSKEYLKDSFKV